MKKRKSKLPLIVFGLLILAAFWLFIKPVKDQTKDNSTVLSERIPVAEIDLANIHSSNLILLDLKSGDVLTEKDSQDKIYPASLTKIMTLLVAIEQLKDIDKKIKLPSEIEYSQLYESNSSMAGFSANDIVKARDLLYGVMLPSGGECTLALAKEISGSEEKFVELMNKKAKELGMNNTHFTNTSGIHDSNHYSTVSDLSFLLIEALENDLFKQIFTAEKYVVKSTSKNPQGITMHSTLFKKMREENISSSLILGGKTGYTDEAGLCLASLGEKNGQEYILITVGAKGDHHTKPFHILDTIKIYEQL